MKSRFAAGEIDARHICCRARFADHTPQKVECEEFGMRSVKILIRAKAVTTVEITNVGELHA
jgi:hypothetical protein